MEVFSSAINYADGKGFLMFLEFKINNGVTNANLKRPVANDDEGGGRMHAAKDHYMLNELQIHTNSIKCRRIANPAERGVKFLPYRKKICLPMRKLFKHLAPFIQSRMPQALGLNSRLAKF